MSDIETKSNTKVLKNGAIYDMDAKRIVSIKPELAQKNTQITSENASVMQARRIERKRERLEAGAMAAVRDKLPDAFDGADGDDWIEAVAQQVAYKALDKLDPKQVDAARFLLQEAGLSEKQAQTPVSDALDSVTELLRQVAALAGSLNASDNYNYRKHEVVDGEARDADDESDEKKQE